MSVAVWAARDPVMTQEAPGARDVVPVQESEEGMNLLVKEGAAIVMGIPPVFSRVSEWRDADLEEVAMVVEAGAVILAVGYPGKDPERGCPGVDWMS